MRCGPAPCVAVMVYRRTLGATWNVLIHVISSEVLDAMARGPCRLSYRELPVHASICLLQAPQKLRLQITVCTSFASVTEPSGDG